MYLYILMCLSVKPIVKATPVTLTCDIQGGGNIQDWKYSWFKDKDTRNPTTTTTTAELRFSADETDRGEYSCEAKRSDISAAVSLTVSGE